MTDADLRARARRIALYAALSYALGGALSLAICALFLASRPVALAWDIFQSGLIPAAAIIGWFKGREGRDAS